MAQKIKIISGGQTGADYGALVGARLSGIETGGTAPKGFRTENGPNPALGTVFGLVEHSSSEYPPRTECNVMSGDITVWLGNMDSAGWSCTAKFCRKHKKHMQVVHKDWRIGMVEWVASIIKTHNYTTINFAGNRESKNPGLQESTCNFVEALVKELRERNYI